MYSKTLGGGGLRGGVVDQRRRDQRVARPASWIGPSTPVNATSKPRQTPSHTPPAPPLHVRLKPEVDLSHDRQRQTRPAAVGWRTTLRARSRRSTRPSTRRPRGLARCPAPPARARTRARVHAPAPATKARLGGKGPPLPKGGGQGLGERGAICACVRACVRVCVRACLPARLRACPPACVPACVLMHL